MAEESEGRKESTTEWETLYNRSSERQDPQTAEESEGRKESTTEWETLYNRSSERQDPAAAVSQIGNDKQQDGIISIQTKCMGTQTDPYSIPEEKIRIVAREIAQVFHLTTHKDAECTWVLKERIHKQLGPVFKKLWASSETNTDSDTDSPSWYDLLVNYFRFMETFFNEMGITREEIVEMFRPQYEHMVNQARTRSFADIVCNVKRTTVTQSAMASKLKTGHITRTQKNNIAAGVGRSVTAVSSLTTSKMTYTQTEPCYPYDISEEILKEMGLQSGRKIMSLTNECPDEQQTSDNNVNRIWRKLSEDGMFPYGADEQPTSDNNVNRIWRKLSEDGMFSFGFQRLLLEELIDLQRTCPENTSSLGDFISGPTEVLPSKKDTENATGTNTQTDDIPDSLKSAAQEIAEILDVYTDIDTASLEHIHHIESCDQRRNTLVDLMGITPADSSVMEIDCQNESGCDDKKINDADQKTRSTLSKLINDCLGERKSCRVFQSENTNSDSGLTQLEQGTYNMDEHTSLVTSSVMTCIGYGWKMRKKRSEMYRKFDKTFSYLNYFGLVTIYTSGSKSEGLTSVFENDIDLMCCLTRAICVENDIDTSDISSDKAVLIMETCYCYPGYCRLVLDKDDDGLFIYFLSKAMFGDETGRLMLSSDLFVIESSKWSLYLEQPFKMRHERAGPSTPYSFSSMNFDRVMALPCHCPSILKRWAERPRQWPPQEIIQKVVSLGGFATPVGFKGSEHHHIEWRICFNTAETELINNWNDIQAKLYVLLKMVVKDILKPRGKEITSYTVKNIVLWLAEKTPQESFHSRSLLHWFKDGLGELRTTIATNTLAYYMIPERNLMAASGLEDEQQRVWIETLTETMNEGPLAILRLKKIRQAILSYPEQLLWYSKMRTELELLMLMVFGGIVEYVKKPWAKNNEIKTRTEILMRFLEIVTEIHQRLNNEGFWFYEEEDLVRRMLM